MDNAGTPHSAIQDTCIEKCTYNKYLFFVKREDNACLAPGPPFAKVRGLFPQLQHLKAKGVQVVGYMETTISMAGWGVSYFAKKLGMQAVIYKPTYIDGKNRHNQEIQVKKWEENDAIIRNIQATRLQINWFQARKELLEEFPNAYMLEQGLPFKQTVLEVSKQVTKEMKKFKTIVMCIGSGTMAAGVLKGLQQQNIVCDLYGIFVAPKNEKKMKQKIYGMAGIFNSGFFNVYGGNLILVDTGCAYTDKEITKCPFPCNPYYDRKAWKWFMANKNDLEQPVLFWNIGA